MRILPSSSPVWRDEEAASGVEYALLASLIAAVIATGAGALGENVLGLWNDACNVITAAIRAALQ